MTENTQTLLNAEQYFTARIYAGTLPPKQQKVELEAILAHCIQKGLVREVHPTIKLLDRTLKPKELNALWAAQNAYEDARGAILVARMFSKQQRDIKLRKILNICLLNDWLSYAELACQQLGRGFSSAELKLILTADKHNDWVNSQNIVRDMSPLHRNVAIEEIIKDYVSRGEWDKARYYATLLQRKLTNDELTIIVAKLIEGQHTNTAVIVVDAMEEPLRSEQLSVMLKFFVDEQQIDRALDTAERLGLNLEPDQLKKLREMCIANGWRIGEAKKIAKLMNEPLTPDELRQMLSEIRASIIWSSSIDVKYVEIIAICLSESDRKEQLILTMNAYLAKQYFSQAESIAKMLDGQRVTITEDYQ